MFFKNFFNKDKKSSTTKTLHDGPVVKKALPKKITTTPTPLKKVTSNITTKSLNKIKINNARTTRLSDVILNPRFTEKAATVGEKGVVYIFDISPRATKSAVKSAIHIIYGVVPAKINICRIAPQKRVLKRPLRLVRGNTKGIKKAYVYLKKGDTINLS